MFPFLQESIVNGEDLTASSQCCEHFVIFMFQIWDLADTDGKGILNKQV